MVDQERPRAKRMRPSTEAPAVPKPMKKYSRRDGVGKGKGEKLHVFYRFLVVRANTLHTMNKITDLSG